MDLFSHCNLKNTNERFNFLLKVLVIVDESRLLSTSTRLITISQFLEKVNNCHS